MNIRFVLYKIGANPDLIEIDEAIPLVDLYNEDRAASSAHSWRSLE